MLTKKVGRNYLFSFFLLPSPRIPSTSLRIHSSLFLLPDFIFLPPSLLLCCCWVFFYPCSPGLDVEMKGIREIGKIWPPHCEPPPCFCSQPGKDLSMGLFTFLCQTTASTYIGPPTGRGGRKVPPPNLSSSCLKTEAPDTRG